MGTLRLDGVDKVYRVGTFGSARLHAVKDVSFEVKPGEVISLIGESGSGKSTIGRMILRLSSISGGRILYDGEDVSRLDGADLKAYRRKVQGVFQDPFSSYNPIFKADRVFGLIHDAFFPEVASDDWHERVLQALRNVSLDPDGVLGKYPHQLSGGQLQRMLVARALLLDIEFLVADEIISMLDASTRVDVLNLLGDLKAGGLGVLFVTHDLSLGNYISDQAIILRKGRIVERGPTTEVFDASDAPLHARCCWHRCRRSTIGTSPVPDTTKPRRPRAPASITSAIRMATPPCRRARRTPRWSRHRRGTSSPAPAWTRQSHVRRRPPGPPRPETAEARGDDMDQLSTAPEGVTPHG